MDDTTGLPPQDAPLRLLVVCGRSAQVQAVRGIVAAWPRAVDVQWTTDPLEAVRLTLAESPHLAIVDARMDRAGGKALIRQIARWNAGLEVFAFDERDTLGSLPQPSTWHWSELAMVLSWWARRHLGLPPDAQKRLCEA